MPHITVEYAGHLDETHCMTGVCQTLFDAAVATGIFPNTAAIRVCAVPFPFSHSGAKIQSFAHVTINLFAGRSETTKAELTRSILAALEQVLPDVGSLAVDIKDIDAASYAYRSL
ncbi:MAG TPA: 5-carboxymethyl-2-hydroxymuconate isomerase [Rhodobacteraceae bacterium]|jgi:5-carboxymethyl-2-hydroxymuconate isomerase|nr:5-carboxymethyl-2-hydroxymuconate isomerase [Paracoccaceae bacterium]